MKFKYFLLLFLLFSLNAQESISGGFKSYHNLYKNNFHNYWDQQNPGAGFFIKIPYHYVNLTGGCDYFSFTGKPLESINSYNGKTADFYSLYIYGGVETEFSLSNLKMITGLKTGNNRMVFDDDIVDEAIKSETELFIALYGEIYYQITDNLYAGINIEYNKTFLHKPVELVYGGAGFYYTFQMPELFKEIFK